MTAAVLVAPGKHHRTRVRSNHWTGDMPAPGSVRAAVQAVFIAVMVLALPVIIALVTAGVL